MATPSFIVYNDNFPDIPVNRAQATDLTSGKIVKASDTETIADSIISDNGSTITIGGGLKETGTTQTGSSYTIPATVQYVICNAGSTILVTLPASSGSGQKYEIKNICSGTAVVSGNGTDTIDDERAQELYQYECIQVLDISTGKWSIV